jgi:hypothetical protein
MASRYLVERIENYPWGGVEWAIWDNERSTWADDLGRYLSREGAERAVAAAKVETAADPNG